jgi:hypothetical protein
LGSTRRRPGSKRRHAGSGTPYQVEAEAFWDSTKEGDLRVIVKVDDVGWRAFVPLSEDFILAPDGSFVGE